MIRKILCFVGLHQWKKTTIYISNNMVGEKNECKHCPAIKAKRRFNWDEFGAVVAFTLIAGTGLAVIFGWLISLANLYIKHAP